MIVEKELDTKRIRNLRIDDRGRVTVPKDLRDEMGLEEGDRVEVAFPSE